MGQSPRIAIIAIVDDERAVRSGLSNLLQSVGYETDTFDSAEAFLRDSVRLASVVLAIVDVKLRGASGFELFDTLIGLPAPPPVIFISGHGDETVQQQALERGAVAFLRKPIDVDMLLRHIERVLAAGEGTA